MGETLATVRGSIYEGLAFAFSPPRKKFYRVLGSQLLRPLKSLRSTFAWPSLKAAEALSDLVGKGQHGLSNELTSIKAEYYRLFVGPYHLPALPYASVYLESEPTVMGPSTVKVLRSYEEAGFFLSPSFKDLPDHIIAELEFMALLCEEEGEAWHKEDLPQAEKLLGREETFLGEHLAQWIPRFASRVHSSTDSPFYRALASLLKDHVFIDRDGVHALRVLIASEGLMPTKEGTRDGT